MDSIGVPFGPLSASKAATPASSKPAATPAPPEIGLDGIKQQCCTATIAVRWSFSVDSHSKCNTLAEDSAGVWKSRHFAWSVIVGGDELSEAAG